MYWENRKIPALVALLVALAGWAWSIFSYRLLGRSEGVEFKRRRKCIPVGYAGDGSKWGDALGILGIGFWCVHVCFALVDFITKPTEHGFEKSVLYPLMFASVEIGHGLFLDFGWG